MGADKDIFSTHDVARVCRVTPMTVIRWIEEGKIPAFKTVGGHRRVLRPDLEAFCRARGLPFASASDATAGRVLIVDPDLTSREALATMARAVASSLAIEQAADAFDAGRLLVEFRPGLVLLDQRLPGVDALELCARLSRARDSQPASVVAIVPASAPDLDRAFRARGAVACLVRPPGAGELARVICGVLGIPAPGRANQAPRAVIVDLDPVRGGQTAQLLEDSIPGCRVARPRSLVEAMLEIGAGQPELVVIAADLPEVRAHELVQQVRARLPAGRTTVLVTTAVRDEEAASRLELAGADSVLAPPFDPAVLTRALASPARPGQG